MAEVLTVTLLGLGVIALGCIADYLRDIRRILRQVYGDRELDQIAEDWEKQQQSLKGIIHKSNS